MWHNIGWKVGQRQIVKETIVKVRAFLLLGALLTTGCIDLRVTGSIHFDHNQEIQQAEQYCASYNGLSHLEVSLGEHPHYTVHCNQVAPPSRHQTFCTDCTSGDENRSYRLTASMIETARTVCKEHIKLLFIEVKLRTEKSYAICQSGLPIQVR